MYVDLEVMDRFEELECIISNASSIPFSQKSGLDKEELINNIKASLPEELKQAHGVNQERHKIINDSKQEALEIVEQAKKEAERIKEEYENNIEELKKNSQEILDAYLEASEPVVKAEEKANEMISRAELLAKEIRLGSIEYAEDVLTTVEHNLKSILQEVERNRIELNPGK